MTARTSTFVSETFFDGMIGPDLTGHQLSHYMSFDPYSLLCYTREDFLNGCRIMFPHQRADILHLSEQRAVFFKRLGQGDGIEHVHRQIHLLELLGRQGYQPFSQCLQRQGFFFLLRFAYLLHTPHPVKENIIAGPSMQFALNDAFCLSE